MTNKSNSKEIRLFINTTKKNLLVNLGVSLIMAIILSYISSLKGWGRPWIFFIFFLFFYVLFRIGEFLFTGKSLTYSPLLTYVDEGRAAFLFFLLNITILILLIIAFIIINPK